MRANWTSSFVSLGMRPNPAVNTDTRRRGFARAAVAGYLARQAP